MPEKPKPQRGLNAIREARELRAVRKEPTASSKFWLWSFIGIAAISIFYWKKTTSQNDVNRNRILAKQRGIASEVGPLYYPLRDKLERWTMNTARTDWDGDTIAPELAQAADKGKEPALFKRPGIYLRLDQPNARAPETIRKASQGSLRDAFSACLLHTPSLPAHQGAACRKTKDCAKGEVCNELGICALPTQPYNLRIAYKGLRVLEPDWVSNVETASEELRLRLFETDLDDAIANDIPVALDLLKRAQYFLVVVDQLPEGFAAPKDIPVEQAVQSEVHPVRVALYDIGSGAMLFRGQRTIDVSIPAVPGDPDAMDAQRRQILNCALAEDIRGTLSNAR